MKRIFIVLLAAAILLAGCGSEPPTAEHEMFAMDTVITMNICGQDAQKAVTELQALIYDLENTWSVTRSDSTISLMNKSGSADHSEVPLISKIQNISQQTNGFYDPQLYSVCQAWGFYEDNYRVPTQDEIDLALNQSRWDLGGALKGHCGDEAVRILNSLNVNYAILNLGGNIQTFNNKLDGTPWQIGIQNPDGGDPVGVISVQGTMSIVTSGDYQRYFELDGRKYHHIIDPRTGYPADSGLRSVTVICSDGLFADCMSTALFVMGLEEGSEFWRQNGGFEAVFLTTNGEIYATEGVTLSECEFEVIHK